MTETYKSTYNIHIYKTFSFNINVKGLALKFPSVAFIRFYTHRSYQNLHIILPTKVI